MSAVDRRSSPVDHTRGEMFVVVDDDELDDAVSRSMSFRRCPVVRPVRRRRSCVHRPPSTTATTPDNPADGIMLCPYITNVNGFISFELSGCVAS